MTNNSNPLGTFTTLGNILPAKLVDKNDPEKRGRIKLRLITQLESQIPDDKLPWTVPEGLTMGGNGSFQLGRYVIGSFFNVMVKEDGQSLSILNLISSPGKGAIEQTTGKGFIPLHVTKEEQNKRIKETKASDGNIKNEKQPEVKTEEKSDHDKARDDTHGPSVHGDKLPIGQEKYAGDNDILNFIKKIDPSNTSGAFQPSVDIMQKLLKSQDPLRTLQSIMGGGLYGILNSVLGQLKKNNNNKKSEVIPNLTCMIEGRIGTFQYNANTGLMVCVPLPTANNVIEDEIKTNPSELTS